VVVDGTEKLAYSHCGEHCYDLKFGAAQQEKVNLFFGKAMIIVDSDLENKKLKSPPLFKP